MLWNREPTADDLFHMQRCHEHDPWHRDDASFDNWLNASGGLTTFYDERGPVFHMAFTPDGDTLWMHAQFDPQGGKFRTANAIMEALNRIEDLASRAGYKRLGLWTKSPRLAVFMQRIGFTLEGENLILDLEEINAT